MIMLSVIALSAKAQEQKYHEFAYDGKYGIVDSEGQEIIEPSYQWKVYTLHYKSPYIALNSYNNGAFIINFLTGIYERFTFLADTYLVDIDGKKYVYAYDDNRAFLMNNLDLEERKFLPKRYKEIRQSGNYLIGYLDSEGEEKTVDIFTKEDFQIKLSNQKVKEIKDYARAEVSGRLYAFIKQNSTVFYDENLTLIAVAPKELKGFNEVQDYLRSTVNIEIANETYPMEGAMTGPAPDYPHIGTRKETHEDGYAVFNICQSQNDCTPFFKFKWTNNSPLYRLVADRYSNKIEAWYRKEHGSVLIFLFYTDVKQKTVLFPQKYWTEIDLQLIVEQPELVAVELQFGNDAEVGIHAATGESPARDNGHIHTSVDIPAHYPGGTQAFAKFFSDNFAQSGETMKGQVIVDFTVEPDGHLSNIKVVRDFGRGSGIEAVRVLKLTSSQWKPAIKDGKPVRSVFRQPITIDIESEEKEVGLEPVHDAEAVKQVALIDDLGEEYTTLGLSENYYYSVARARYNDQNYDDALTAVNQGLTDFPTSRQIHALKCLIYVAQKNYPATIEAATQGLAVNPEDYWFYEIRATSYYFNNHPEKALQDYREALALNTTNARYYSNYLKLLNEMQADDEMVSVYQLFEIEKEKDMAFEQGNFLGDVYFYSAFAYYRKDDAARAIKLMDEALLLSPDTEVYFANRGYFHGQVEDYESGIRDLSKAIEFDSVNANYYAGRAVMYLKLKAYENAKDDLLIALRHGNSSVGVYNNLAMAYMWLDDYKSAIAQYDILLKNDPNDLLIIGNYGFCLLELSQADEALQKFQKVYSHTPDEIDILIGIVLANQVKGNQREVEKHLDLIYKNTDKKPHNKLLDDLEKEGYHYSPNAKKLWATLF